jgi:hypothetical protein
MMQAPETGREPLSSDRDETPAQALVRLLEQLGLADSARELLEELEKRRRDRREAAGREVLAYLLEGNAPPTAEELETVRREWQG